MTRKLSQTLQPEGRVLAGSGGIVGGGSGRQVRSSKQMGGMCDGRYRELCGSAHGNKTGSRL